MLRLILSLTLLTGLLHADIPEEYKDKPLADIPPQKYPELDPHYPDFTDIPKSKNAYTELIELSELFNKADEQPDAHLLPASIRYSNAFPLIKKLTEKNLLISPPIKSITDNATISVALHKASKATHDFASISALQGSIDTTLERYNQGTQLTALAYQHPQHFVQLLTANAIERAQQETILLLLSHPNLTTQHIAQLEQSLPTDPHVNTAVRDTIRKEFHHSAKTIRQLKSGELSRELQNLTSTWRDYLSFWEMLTIKITHHLGRALLQPNRTIAHQAALIKYSLQLQETPYPSRSSLPIPTSLQSIITNNSPLSHLSNFTGRTLIRSNTRSYTKFIKKLTLRQTERRMTRIACALRRYHLDHKKLPTSLSELSPNYITTLPLDPYSLQPFLYDAEKQQLWSVGSDLKDEGGSPLKQIREHRLKRSHYLQAAKKLNASRFANNFKKTEPTLHLRFPN